MGRFRSWRRALLILFVSFCAVVFLALTFVQAEQHIFRRRAEQLLSEIQSLELRKTPWPEAQARLAHWSANTEVGPHCDEHKCSVTITMNELTAGIVSQLTLPGRLDDYFRWKLNFSYNTGPFVHLFEALWHLHMRLGGRPSRVMATIGMRDGVLWSKSFQVAVETYTGNVPGDFEYEYSLWATTSSVPRFRDRGLLLDPQLALHQNFQIGRPGGCTGCRLGWVRFTPYAEPADVRRLMQLNLSCLTRWHPCRTQMDIMPNAWSQYEAEGPRVRAMWNNLPCSPLTAELLGRDSDVVVVGEIVGYRNRPDRQGHQGTVEIRLLDRLKGAADWNIGLTRDVAVSSEDVRDVESLRHGSRFIFAVDTNYSQPMEIDFSAPCRVLPQNEENLKLIRRGIEQDYSATEQTR